MRLHTPSSYPRLQKCLGSAVLPWVDEEYEGTRRGTALHMVPEEMIGGATREQALAAVPAEWRGEAEELDTTPFELLRGAMAEAGLAWNPATGACRVLGHGMTREQARAACLPGEVPMVLDVLSHEPGQEEALVIDWKHGRGEELGPAAEHWQILTYASVAMVALGAQSARCFLATWRGLRWVWDEARLDNLDALAHLEQVRARLEQAQEAHARYRASGEVPPLQRGQWCQWCPSQRTCPAVASVLVAAARGEAGLATSRPVAELTLSEAGGLLVRLREVQKQVERALRDLNALARQTPLLLPDGGEYVPRERPRLDADRAWEALAKVYGKDFADLAAPLARVGSLTSTVRDAVRQALLPERQELVAQGRVAKDKATLKAMLREVREVLAAAGALDAKMDDGEPESGPEGDG